MGDRLGQQLNLNVLRYWPKVKLREWLVLIGQRQCSLPCDDKFKDFLKNI
ncbi:hypothetical protein D082_02310 [Synechocystis sp. PCC 6714]|nr:hypothetical protein D082_02310 [Synechocystis sp. PCC 6714]